MTTNEQADPDSYAITLAYDHSFLKDRPNRDTKGLVTLMEQAGMIREGYGYPVKRAHGTQGVTVTLSRKK